MRNALCSLWSMAAIFPFVYALIYSVYFPLQQFGSYQFVNDKTTISVLYWLLKFKVIMSNNQSLFIALDCTIFYMGRHCMYFSGDHEMSINHCQLVLQQATVESRMPAARSYNMTYQSNKIIKCRDHQVFVVIKTKVNKYFELAFCS